MPSEVPCWVAVGGLVNVCSSLFAISMCFWSRLMVFWVLSINTHVHILNDDTHSHICLLDASCAGGSWPLRALGSVSSSSPGDGNKSKGKWLVHMTWNQAYWGDIKAACQSLLCEWGMGKWDVLSVKLLGRSCWGGKVVEWEASSRKGVKDCEPGRKYPRTRKSFGSIGLMLKPIIDRGRWVEDGWKTGGRTAFVQPQQQAEDAGKRLLKSQNISLASQ